MAQLECQDEEVLSTVAKLARQLLCISSMIGMPSNQSSMGFDFFFFFAKFSNRLAFNEYLLLYVNCMYL